ncbi:hypothetical protein CROQUDRAFT_42814, partial [Cronartium quercuum f. sp. fusiforme G11]
TVAQLICEIDPVGIDLCKCGKLKCQMFWCAGPNNVWSSDGHDKLKPFGIAIYGFIDARSRKVLRLDAGPSNNDPRCIAYHYLQTALELGSIPQQTCTAHGSETGIMEAYQMAFLLLYGSDTREQSQHAHIFKTSPKNQKIESLWSLVRKRRGL